MRPIFPQFSQGAPPRWLYTHPARPPRRSAARNPAPLGQLVASFAGIRLAGEEGQDRPEVKQRVGHSDVDELEEAQELLVTVLPGCGYADRAFQPPGEPDPGKCPHSMFRWVKP